MKFWWKKCKQQSYLYYAIYYIEFFIVIISYFFPANGFFINFFFQFCRECKHKKGYATFPKYSHGFFFFRKMQYKSRIMYGKQINQNVCTFIWYYNVYLNNLFDIVLSLLSWRVSVKALSIQQNKGKRLLNQPKRGVINVK